MATCGIALAALVLTGCQAESSGEETAPVQANAAAAAPGQPYRVDMDAIFPAGEGRDLVLNNCQSCHVWVPIVILQMNEQQWRRSQREHRERVENLVDADFETLYEYLVTTFTPDRPVPEIPPALLEAWTTY